MSISKKLIKTLALTLTLSTISIYAVDSHAHEEESHKDHDHAKHEHNESSCSSHRFDKFKNEVSKETVEEVAKQKVLSLVEEKKIHPSWAGLPISKIGKTHYGDTNDWLVGFDNPKMKNEKKRTLYIFVNVKGEVRGANYTGN